MAAVTSNYQLVCGMEVHAELKTQSKMFCSCENDPFHAAAPNIHTCPVCLGMPGGLPVANKKAIEWTIQLGLALGSKINLFSKFDRKHYFYPDLPKGYQISQYDLPFCEGGHIDTPEGRVRIRRIHLEEDTAKLQHTSIEAEKVSLIDFNRSGVPLIEIVTEPDIISPAHAKSYAKALRKLLRYLDIADCDMEQGGMRLEANVSLREKDVTTLPEYKVELKNINSFRFLEQAITFEIDRQTTELSQGNTLQQETRGWDSHTSQTFTQRVKEEAADYRYFPDPDIPPIVFTQADVDALGENIPELPATILARWQSEYGIDPRFADPLIVTAKQATFFEESFALLKKSGSDPNKFASDIHNKKFRPDASLSVKQVVEKYIQATSTDSVDETKLTEVISAVLKQESDAVNKYKSGQQQVLGFLMGQVMRSLKVKADPQQVRTALGKALDT